MSKDVRWRQRFQNFDRAFRRLEAAVSSYETLSTLEKEGLVQRFEYTFELAWKTLGDYLEYKEVDARFPRDVIKAGFQYGLIDDGEMWMDMLEKRNLMAHTYDEERFAYVVGRIRDDFFVAVAQVHALLGTKE